MRRKLLANQRLVPVVLCLLVAPLVALPGKSYSLSSQEWWLPGFLTVLTVLALIQLVIRRSQASWPWYLLGFSQGFNIISRLMMLLSRVTIMVGGTERFNSEAVLIFVGTMALSAFGVWYTERPDVRAAMAR
jgi:hypothetical protein